MGTFELGGVARYRVDGAAERVVVISRTAPCGERSNPAVNDLEQGRPFRLEPESALKPTYKRYRYLPLCAFTYKPIIASRNIITT